MKGKQGLNPPGPGTYDSARTFGKTGSHLSFSPRLNYETIHLRREKAKPGPGNYDPQKVLSQNIASSTHTNGFGQKWTKQRRFETPTLTTNNPPPGQYSPKTNFNENGLFKSSAKCVIGKNKMDVLDMQYNMREMTQNPGPGAYKRFSDFNQTML